MGGAASRLGFIRPNVHPTLIRPQTCGVVVLCRTLAQTILYVLFVACVTLVVEREAQAYLNDFISAFAYSCGWQVRPSTRCGAQ